MLCLMGTLPDKPPNMEVTRLQDDNIIIIIYVVIENNDNLLKVFYSVTNCTYTLFYRALKYN